MEGSFGMWFRREPVVPIEEAALDPHIAMADRPHLKNLLEVRARCRAVAPHARANNDAMKRIANRRLIQVNLSGFDFRAVVFRKVWESFFQNVVEATWAPIVVDKLGCAASGLGPLSVSERRR